jgi:pheromone shutdown-related protein TraB
MITTLTTQNNINIHLLGTAHISAESVREVETAVRSGQYDAIAVELCQSRYQAMFASQDLEKSDLLALIKQGKLPQMLLQVLLASYQERLARQVETPLGAELKAAVTEAKAHNLPLLLIDRDVRITLQRVRQANNFWQNFQLLGLLIAGIFEKQAISREEVEKLKEGDMLSHALSEMAQGQPAIYRVIIQERDQYLAYKLQEAANSGQYQNILAVVGAGHVPGMVENFEKIPSGNEATQLSALEQISDKKGFWHYFPYLVIGLIILGFIIGFSQNQNLGWQILGQWIVINGSLAAIGSAIAFAHPLTIISAFLAAPLTSLNPTVGVGMVTAFVEALVRKPNLGHLKNLRQDIEKWQGWWKNPLGRVFLVFFFSSLGSALGTYIAGFQIWSAIFQ